MEFAFRPKEVDVGGRRRVYQVLDHPGSVAVVALRDGRVALVRQLRPAVDEWLWEVPAGTLTPGEAAEAAAARELEEETGWRAGELREVARFYLAPGYSSELMHLVVAERLTPSQAHPDEGEFIERVGWFTAAELTRMARRGELKDAKSLAALWWLASLGLAGSGDAPGPPAGA